MNSQSRLYQNKWKQQASSTVYMGQDSGDRPLGECLAQLTRNALSALDFLPDGSLAEKMINLSLTGPPRRLSANLATLFQEIDNRIEGVDTSNLKVITLGGGTGLSSIIGGDSRRWTGKKTLSPVSKRFSHASIA